MLQEDPTRRIMAKEVLPWQIASARPRYDNFEQLPPATLHATGSTNGNIEFNILLQGRSCVEVTSAYFYNPVTNSYEEQVTIEGGTFSSKRERDTAKYFGLKKNEIATLKFDKKNDTLFIVRQKQE